MGTQGDWEGVWEAFQWLLTGLLPGELEEGQQATAKHFLDLQEKVVDEAQGDWGLVNSPKATTLPIALTLHEQSGRFVSPRPAPQSYF